MERKKISKIYKINSEKLKEENKPKLLKQINNVIMGLMVKNVFNAKFPIDVTYDNNPISDNFIRINQIIII